MSESPRKFANLIRTGVIYSVNYSQAEAQVQSGELVTDFIPFISQRAGKTKSWSPPDIGEQVLIFSPNGDLDNAVILGAIHSDETQFESSSNVISTKYPDGAVIEYNFKESILSLTGIKTAKIQATDKITLDCPHVHVTGKITSDGDQIAGTISQQKHKHKGVSSGKDTTQEPI